MTTLKHHQESCRAMSFSSDGRFLFTGSSDCSIGVVDCDSGTLIYTNYNAHDSPIYSMLNYDHLLATGDDDGIIKAWDLRQQKCVFEFQENNDFISDMLIRPEYNLLLATSGDGTLGVYDIRKGALDSLSDTQDDELLSLAIIKNGNKVVCGTQDGVLALFSWEQWADISDRFPGHPKSIDTMVKIDEDTIITGSSDGLIRVVQIFPNKLLGVIGEHEEFPIERIRLSRDNKYLGSCSHDNTVKFWNVGYLFQNDDDDDVNITESDTEMREITQEKEKEKRTEREDEMEAEAPSKKKSKIMKEKRSRFFADL